MRLKTVSLCNEWVNDLMNYAKIEFCDVVNGPGVRTTLFVSGCSHNCKGCHNKEAQNFKFGSEFDEDQKSRVLDSLSDPYIDGLSISGGDPLHPNNVSCVLNLVKELREIYGHTKTVWVWTGYLFSELTGEQAELVEMIDVLVDGRFVESLKDAKLRYRGSSNQNIIFIK